MWIFPSFWTFGQQYYRSNWEKIKKCTQNKFS